MNAEDLADVAMLRAAGYYAAATVDPDEDMHPHAAQPGAMPTVNDLVAELETVRGLLKALVSDEAPIVAFNDDYPPDDGLSEVACLYCQTGNGRCDTEYEWHVNLSDPANHTPDCPWRLATEYVQQMEASK